MCQHCFRLFASLSITIRLMQSVKGDITPQSINKLTTSRMFCVQLPQPVDPWDDVFVADTLPTACIQNTGGWLWITHPGWNRHGEDCLYMDVYAPEVRIRTLSTNNMCICKFDFLLKYKCDHDCFIWKSYHLKKK